MSSETVPTAKEIAADIRAYAEQGIGAWEELLPLVDSFDDMLAALKAVRDRFQSYRLDPDASAVLDRVHAALLKSEGR